MSVYLQIRKHRGQNSGGCTPSEPDYSRESAEAWGPRHHREEGEAEKEEEDEAEKQNSSTTCGVGQVVTNPSHASTGAPIHTYRFFCWYEDTADHRASSPAGTHACPTAASSSSSSSSSSPAADALRLNRRCMASAASLQRAIASGSCLAFSNSLFSRSGKAVKRSG